jgi:hypothetical protein
MHSLPPTKEEKMNLNTSKVEAEITKFMSQDVEATARETKFVQRVSTMNGQGFLKTIVLGFIEDPESSLNDLIQVSADLGIEITAQGLDQRLNEHALTFLKKMFSRAIEQFKTQVPLPVGILEQFNGVYLTDSSAIALPESMADEYPGCGGNGPESSLKMQLTFELLHGNLAQVTLRAGREPDQAYRDYIQNLTPESLSITDLGYFTLNAFKTIMVERQAYVLSRFNNRTGLLTPDGEELDLLKLAQSCPNEAFEVDVLMGKQPRHRLPCRLLVFPVPQQVADQRRRKAKETAQRKGRAVSKRHLALMSWTFLITNVPAEMLPMEAAVTLYRIRWQIELVFKLWKSYCGIERVIGLRRERVLVELYGKMIGIVLTHFLLAPLRMPEGTLANREISPVKVRKIFRRFIRDLARSLDHSTKFQDTLSELLKRIIRFGFKEKRTKEPNAFHRLALISAACGFESQPELA